MTEEIFGHKRYEKIGEWRKLHTQKVLYFSPKLFGLSSTLGWAGYVARTRERRYAYRFLVGETEGKRPLEGNQLRWKDNNKVGLKETGW
jgi:hypothetical protein